MILKDSIKRKRQLGLENLTYSQLSRCRHLKDLNYELHHIVPRYRLKGYPVSFVNCPENIAVLTSKEHLMAHYHLSNFESDYYKQNARVAFLMLFNLKKSAWSDIENLSKEDISKLADKAVELRSIYFGSPEHKAGSSKAGKISGQKRKESFKNCPEFRNYLLEKLKITPEKRKEISNRLKLKNLNLPPWKINKGKTSNSSKYKNQLWEYFDSIYIGHIRYGFSYKLLANILDVDYSRICNIVRKLSKQKSNLPLEFKDYLFYEQFCNDYQPTFNEEVEKLFEYFSSETPWNKFSKNSGWLMFDKMLEDKVFNMRPYRISGIYNTGYYEACAIREELLKLKGKDFKDWHYYSLWKIFKMYESRKVSELTHER